MSASLMDRDCKHAILSSPFRISLFHPIPKSGKKADDGTARSEARKQNDAKKPPPANRIESNRTAMGKGKGKGIGIGGFGGKFNSWERARHVGILVYWRESEKEEEEEKREKRKRKEQNTT